LIRLNIPSSKENKQLESKHIHSDATAMLSLEKLWNCKAEPLIPWESCIHSAQHNCKWQYLYYRRQRNHEKTTSRRTI